MNAHPSKMHRLVVPNELTEGGEDVKKETFSVFVNKIKTVWGKNKQNSEVSMLYKTKL